MKFVGVSIAALGLYFLYHGYHPVFQPFQLGVSVFNTRVNGHTLLSGPFMHCVKYDDARCRALCPRKGSDCERARCKEFCLKQEIGIAYKCVLSTELGVSVYALDELYLQSAGNRQRARDLCNAVFPLHSLYSLHTVFDSDTGGFKQISFSDVKKRVWLGYSLVTFSICILLSHFFKNEFHIKKN